MAFNYIFNPLSNLSKLLNTPDKKHFERPKLDEFISKNSVNVEIRNYSGFITSLNQGEGVINNNIYFSVDSASNIHFKVGDRVQGEASRVDDNHAWRAVRVTSMNEDWEDEGIKSCSLENYSTQPSGNHASTFIGKVVQIIEKLIFLNSGDSCYVNEENCQFKILVGDWVHCEKSESEEASSNCSSTSFSASKICPLRRKTIQGSITNSCHKFFIINGEVYSPRALLPGIARVGTLVSTDVIESSQENFSWRAISVRVKEYCPTENLNFADLTSFLNTQRNGEKHCVARDNADYDNFSHFRKMISVEGTFEVVLKGKGYTQFLKIVVKNVSADTLPCLGVEISSSSYNNQLVLDQSCQFPVEILPGREFPIALTCSGKVFGVSEEVLALRFCHNETKFSVRKSITITVHDAAPFPLPSKHVHFSRFKGRCKVIKGEKPVYASPFIPVKLPRAEVPLTMWEAVLNGSNVPELFSLKEPLSPGNYFKKFSNLLHLEEIEMEIHMRRFDIPCTTFEPHGEYLSLTVEGLSEKRPSLMVGDTVIASSPSSPDSGATYEGVIHHVLYSKVLLKFHPNFHSEYLGEDYAVKLCFNRTPLRRCHLAISLVLDQLGTNVLFPSKFNFQLPQVSFIDPEFRLGGRFLCCSNASTEEGVLQNVEEAERSKEEVERSKEAERSKEEAERSKEEASSTKKGRNGAANSSQKPCFPFKIDKRGYCSPVLKCRRKIGKKSLPELRWFNKTLNLEQKGAVKRILEGATRPLPYVIFGPPGTGKTVTLVESLLQIYTMVSHSRILVVSGSNSASDLVAERSIQGGKLKLGELVRLNGFNRNTESVSELLKPYCVVGSDLELVVRHRVIVATATTAGILYTAKLRNGHFTHVLIDEAGQLTEPETCIALGLVNSVSGQVVLAGDPKQLGPLITSPYARRFGLASSLLHRLCSSVLYQPHNERLRKMYSEEDAEGGVDGELEEEGFYFEPRLVTLLVRNYRSHPDLLSLPSSLFYHSLLQSTASNTSTTRLLEWEELPNPSCPLIFHPVRGENCQEGDSPSWFNPVEAFQVSRYTSRLLEFGLDPCDVGIIAPYKKQVEKIRQLLRVFGIEDGIKVGPVEEFQGQEKLAVIVSTVRSSEDMVETDVLHNLGFLRCSERFNVALTRAIGLLIVVGNPLLLAQDCNWKAFLNYCLSKGAIKS